MISKTNEQFAGIILALTATAALALSTPAQAENRFPPQHTDSTFVEFQEPSAQTVRAPWYLDSAARPTPVESKQIGGIDIADATRGIEPYYRAAN